MGAAEIINWTAVSAITETGVHSRTVGPAARGFSVKIRGRSRGSANATRRNCIATEPAMFPFDYRRAGWAGSGPKLFPPERFTPP